MSARGLVRARRVAAAIVAAVVTAVVTAVLAVATTLGAQAAPAAQAPARRAAPDTAALGRTLRGLVEKHRGVVGYTVLDVETGARLTLRGDETFPTASLIKVGILVTLFDLVEKGTIALDDPITLLKVDQVGGSGQLQFLHSGLQLSVRDAAWLMITLSDNTATNLVLDKVNIRRVWAKMEALGLRQTKVHHKSFLRAISSVAPDSSAKYGLGVSTPNESARLFELLARGEAVGPRADSLMLDILTHTVDDDMLQRFVADKPAAHKTGSDDGIRTECSLWRLPDRVVACVFTKEGADKRWLLDNEAQVLMARMGEAIVRAWSR